MAVDALVFDLGGVLVAHDNDALYARLASRCIAGTSPSDIEGIVRDPRWGDGTAPIEQLQAALAERFGYAADWPTFQADWSCHFTLDDSMLALAAALAARQRVMIFSNTNAEHWAFLLHAAGDRLGRFERFLSYEMGLSKPRPEAFVHVARAAGIAPARSLFVDDLAENVEGARRVGFAGHLFDGEAGLRDALRAAGVAPA